PPCPRPRAFGRPPVEAPLPLRTAPAVALDHPTLRPGLEGDHRRAARPTRQADRVLDQARELAVREVDERGRLLAEGCSQREEVVETHDPGGLAPPDGPPTKPPRSLRP